MIVGLHVLETFEVEDADQLVRELIKRGLINFTLEQVKELVEKEWNGDYKWDDLICDDDCISYILSDLAIGYFDWSIINDIFEINIVDQKDPYFKEGKNPKDIKEKVNFT